MKVMSKNTNLSAEKIIKKAKDYFDGNLGLEIKDETDNCCIDFRSNLGFVTLQIFDKVSSREVKLSTREFEYQIQEFLGSL